LSGEAKILTLQRGKGFAFLKTYTKDGILAVFAKTGVCDFMINTE
jgi:hypothetical protein